METLDDVEAIFVVNSLYKRQQLKQKMTRKRKYWVHPLNMKRIIEGQFQVNFLTLQSHPDEFFKLDVNFVIRFIGMLLADSISNVNTIMSNWNISLQYIFTYRQ